MASVTSRAQQLFSRVVPEWLYSKVGANKTTAFTVFAFATFVVLAVVVRRSLSGRATFDSKDDGTKAALEKTPTTEVKETGNSKSVKKIVYVYTQQTSPIYVNWKKKLRANWNRSTLTPMVQVGDRWEIEVTQEESDLELEFHIFRDKVHTNNNLQITYGMCDLKPTEPAGTKTTPPRAMIETADTLKVLDSPSDLGQVKTEPTSTPPTSPSKIKVKAWKNVGLGNTLLCNGSPMTNDGSDDEWEVEIEGTASTANLKFSINDPNNVVEVPFNAEVITPPTS